MIVGTFDDYGRPYIEGRVYLPRFNRLGIVQFRVDTGADFTCLHPRAARSLLIPFNQLETVYEGHGVGGSAAYSRERAVLIFSDDGRAVPREASVWVAMPTSHNEELDSLLGIDIIRDWRMVYDGPNRRIELEAL